MPSPYSLQNLGGCRLVSTPSTINKTFGNIANPLTNVCRFYENFCILSTACYCGVAGFRKKSIATETTAGSMRCGPLNSKEVTS